jgi:hypothetical protein
MYGCCRYIVHVGHWGKPYLQDESQTECGLLSANQQKEGEGERAIIGV